jgi:hypothetical protein
MNFVDHPNLCKSNSFAKYGETSLPPLPPCVVPEPWTVKRPAGPSYVMSKDE